MIRYVILQARTASELRSALRQYLPRDVVRLLRRQPFLVADLDDETVEVTVVGRTAVLRYES